MSSSKGGSGAPSIDAAALNTDIQAELSTYIETHSVNQLFAGMVESVLMEQPENPIQFIVDYLYKHFPKDLETRAPAGAEVAERMSRVAAPSAGAGPGPAVDRGADSNSDDSDDDDDDDVDELPTFSQYRGIRRRTSVSAESGVDPAALKAQWEAGKKVYPKSDHEKRQLRAIMKENLLLGRLDEEQTEIVLDAMSPVLFRDGRWIIKQGDSGDLFYVVESGTPEVYIEANGRTQHIVTYKQGDSFGELALMYGAPRAASVKAKGDCRLWAMDRLTFKVVMQDTTVAKRKKYEAFLSRVPILSTLNDYERSVITDAVREEDFAAGQQICLQGEPGDKFYIVEKGEVSITQCATPESPPVEVMRCSLGSYFGEIALLTNSPRKATATAVLPTHCLVLTRRAFSRVMGPLDDILKRNMAKYETVMAEL